MKSSSDRKQYLLEAYAKGICTQAEKDELLDLLQQEWNSIPFNNTTHNVDWDSMYARITEMEVDEAPVVQMRQKRQFKFIRMVAAAVILFALGIGSYFIFFEKTSDQISNLPGINKNLQEDLLPGSDKAILTLADGKQVFLDSTTGNIKEEDGITVINLNGLISYEDLNDYGKSQSEVYHTIRTPRGGQYKVVLEDGSKIWLNAASSLKYPIAFKGKKRVVTLEGEGYFEIAHNPAKPFYVQLNNIDIEVIGTHFNVNGYNNETATKTTLLEGSVKLRLKDSMDAVQRSIILQPGQQAEIHKENIQLNKDVDVEAVMAWKNGYFHFDNATLPEIMRQIERWYDVEVEFESVIPDRRFGGEISRNTNASGVLKILEHSNVRFRIEGKKIIVLK